MRRTESITNRLWLIEIVLAMATVVAGIIVYLRPAASADLEPPWWHWPLVAMFFFGAAGIHTYRVRRDRRTDLRRAVREGTARQKP